MNIHIQKKKSLGQYFLRAPSYLRAVVDAADIKKGEVILEIGPGEGALTEVLLARGARVIAIEKDHRLISTLKEKFVKEIANKKFVLIEADALNPLEDRFRGDSYKVVGNIPYYITGALVRKYLTEKHQPTTLVFLVQKEVAERIAKSKKESILSLSVKVYGTPVYVKTVPRGAFVPQPGVDSAILLVKDISRNKFVARSTSLRATSEVEAKFFALVKAGFAQKRKMLKRNVERVLGKNTAALMQQAGIAENARAEDVALEQWLALVYPEQSRRTKN